MTRARARHGAGAPADTGADLDAIFGADGALARDLAGYAPRAAQQALAAAVEDALATHTTLVAEAGTGIGKTLAYLIPALRSGQPLILSTGTRHLQDQLYQRDLPLARGALGLPARVVLLKGRTNYLCLHRLDTAALEQGGHAQHTALDRLQHFAARTRSGDIAELEGIEEDAPIWPRVTSTTDNCLGQDCPRLADCFVMKARRAAQQADLVIVNHHLLLADLALKEEGFGELLPSAAGYILDEAHQLPEIAASFFGRSVSAARLNALIRDARLEYLREANDVPGFPATLDHLEYAVRSLRLALGREPGRAPWQQVADRPGLHDALGVLDERLQAGHAALEALAPRGKGLENCARRAAEQLAALRAFAQGGETGEVQWFESFAHGFALHLSPLDCATPLRALRTARTAAWVFTSATLSVGGSLAHFARAVGLGDDDYTGLTLESPFDYARNALCYLPEALPEPQDSGYTRAVVEAAVPVLAASQGHAFLLFTSHRALKEAAELLAGRTPWPLLVQGDAPRAQLLARFRSEPHAVLLGAASFWEGVDVRGPQLSCVIIDKLPFASPGDPLTAARIEALRAQGANPFRDYQLPNAVLALKQGVGRLIRDVHDRGVLVLCDPRVTGKPYGRVFLDSLPPIPRTRRLADVEGFFATPPA